MFQESGSGCDYGLNAEGKLVTTASSQTEGSDLIRFECVSLSEKKALQNYVIETNVACPKLRVYLESSIGQDLGVINKLGRDAVSGKMFTMDISSHANEMIYS